MIENQLSRNPDWSRVEGAIGKENLNKLRSKTVAVYGLGGLGTEIVRLLTMNGLENFYFADPDLVSAANITRHPATQNDIGMSKVKFAEKMVKSKNPNAKVVIDRVDARNKPYSGKCDLLIIAGLGSQHAQEQIANKALEKGRTVLVCGVYNTAEAGEVFVLKPEIGPCYTCYMELTREKLTHIQPPPAQPYGVPIDQVEAVPGLANRIEIIAGFTVETIMDTLLGRSISHHKDPDINMYIFAINKIQIHFPMPEGQEFLGPRAGRFFKLPKSETCNNCYPKPIQKQRVNLNQIIRD